MLIDLHFRNFINDRVRRFRGVITEGLRSSSVLGRALLRRGNLLYRERWRVVQAGWTNRRTYNWLRKTAFGHEQSAGVAKICSIGVLAPKRGMSNPTVFTGFFLRNYVVG